ncbi:MAG: hypothetical protein A2286_10185 [Gammaproteobacteria bacterium RIFOXYA12_FULL_61_12]|nr:MAG: hypothetical protein A2514_14875 [Gammaproteobacteria bacterium RIFOXYD12_FULL_61_37]OGT90377.1 MAG: hypothetical protein A2286_10185 [Gammaproteobacteria bacterium RIFOXYA12_FULL_61_12]
MRKKILVFIDYDMLIRHFVLSGVFRELESAYEVKYVFHSDDTSSKRSIYQDISALKLSNAVSFHLPRKRMGIWDHLYCPTILNRLRGTDYYSERLKLMREVRSRKWVDRYEYLALPGIFQLYSWIFRKVQGIYQPLMDFVRSERPDIVLHPTILQGFFINELVPICRELKIPFVCLMNSWDNPAQKAAATGHPDKLVVWGDQTRQHAIKYMKMPAEDILMFGAAQFQIFRKPVTETDAELRSMFNVPQDKRILLYGGTSKSVAESEHLKILDDAIESGAIPDCHVIYRPHPWRGGLTSLETDFFSCNFRHVTMDPFMEAYYRKAVQTDYKGFDLAEYDVTRKLLHLVDAVTSPLSTILLEAVMHEKPVQILSASEHVDPQAKSLYETATRQIHFADLAGEGVLRCNSAADIPDGCRHLLELAGDPDIKVKLRQLARHFVVMDGSGYGERLRGLADDLTSGPVAH